MTYKLLHDYENTRSLLIENDELWGKMPGYSPKYRAKSKAKDWVAPIATFYSSKNFQGDPTSSPPDICTWSTGNLVLSETAYNIFKKRLEYSGEFLPVSIDGLTYYIFNTLLVIPEEGINDDNAVEVIDSGVHLGLDNYTFNEAFLDGALVFKTNVDRLVYSYCTDEFKNLYEANGFRGLKFEELFANTATKETS